MPLPTPKENEPRDEFVSRCISDLTEKGEGEDAEQRAAICHSQYDGAEAKWEEDKKEKDKPSYSELARKLLDAFRQRRGL